MMTLVNVMGNNASFVLNTANGRQFSVILNAGGSIGLDLSSYTGPYGVAVEADGHSASADGVSDEAKLTVSDAGDKIVLTVT